MGGCVCGGGAERGVKRSKITIKNGNFFVTRYYCALAQSDLINESLLHSSVFRNI